MVRMLKSVVPPADGGARARRRPAERAAASRAAQEAHAGSVSHPPQWKKRLAMQRLQFQAMIRVLPTRTLSSEPSLRTTEVRARLNSQIKCGPFQMWAMRCRALATHSQL